MIIYEVNLTIAKDVYPQFQRWLKGHIKEILHFSGFIQANILKPEEDQTVDQEKVTIQYQLEDRESLEDYFNKFAPKMREEGIKLFKDKFSVWRRIFEVQDRL